MQYDDLISNQLLSPSVASLLFDEKKRGLVLREISYPSIAFNTGLLYTALLQAFLLASSIKSGTPLKDEGFPSPLLDNFKRTWMVTDTRKENQRAGKPWVFSFLIQCTSVKSHELFGDNALSAITTAKNAVLKSEENARHFSNLLSEEGLIDYLRALPLLRSTEIDFENMQFLFRNHNGETCSIDCQPFICFWNIKKNIQSRERTHNCYVLTSLGKGKQMGELCVNLLPLNCRDTIITTKQIYWQAAKNETVRMIFKALDLPTDWLTTEKCWCDLAFMQKLANVAEDALPQYWKMRNSDLSVLCVRERFAALFGDASIRSDILRKKPSSRKLLVANLDNVFFGLFINHGVFKTMQDLFDESSQPEGEQSMNVLFNLFLDIFQSKGYITASERIENIAECNRQIEAHINALRAKVPYESSPQFARRSLEITAEWRAYTVLKTAGIRADNLFADKESIYSIDDYYNMLQNPRTSVKDDLKQVLSLLIEIYGALLDNKPIKENDNGMVGMRIDEEQFYSSMYRIKREISSLDLEHHFQRFADIVKLAEGNEIVEGILGRTCICRSKNVDNFRADILDAIENEQNSTTLSSNKPDFDFSKKYIFISYSHKDAPLIEPFLEHWKSLNFPIYIDEERFYRGMPWTSTAMNAIRDKRCAMVAVFISKNSLISDSVASELTCAKETAKSRFGEGTDMFHRFIHPINLEENREIWEMSRDIKTTSMSNNEISIATEISKIITGINIYSTINDLISGDIDRQIYEMLTYAPAEANTMRDSNYTDLELQIAKFYTFLKYGDDCDWATKDIDGYFHGEYATAPSLANCIYPIVASMKETKIHRDNITMVGYEMVNGSDSANERINYILTTRPLTSPDDYYCIPHNARVGEDCTWMADPLLISYKRMIKE